MTENSKTPGMVSFSAALGQLELTNEVLLWEALVIQDCSFRSRMSVKLFYFILYVFSPLENSYYYYDQRWSGCFVLFWNYLSYNSNKNFNHKIIFSAAIRTFFKSIVLRFKDGFCAVFFHGPSYFV